MRPILFAPVAGALLIFGGGCGYAFMAAQMAARAAAEKQRQDQFAKEAADRRAQEEETRKAVEEAEHKRQAAVAAQQEQARSASEKQRRAAEEAREVELAAVDAGTVESVAVAPEPTPPPVPLPCNVGGKVTVDDVDWSESCDDTRFANKWWRATVLGAIRCYHEQKKAAALARIREEMEASKIAGVVDKGLLHKQQSIAYEEGKQVAGAEVWRKRLKLAPSKCDAVWTHLLTFCMHARTDEDAPSSEECDKPFTEAAFRVQHYVLTKLMGQTNAGQSTESEEE